VLSSLAAGKGLKAALTSLSTLQTIVGETSETLIHNIRPRKAKYVPLEKYCEADTTVDYEPRRKYGETNTHQLQDSL
jgi:hypothetical protein